MDINADESRKALYKSGFKHAFNAYLHGWLNVISFLFFRNVFVLTYFITSVK
jgi:hypothetical protein